MKVKVSLKVKGQGHYLNEILQLWHHVTGLQVVIVSQGSHGGRSKVTWVQGHEGEGQPKGTALMAKLLNI